MTEIDGLLDTNILIDISRAHPPALLWLQANPSLVFAVPSLVRVELIMGANNREEQEKILRLLQPYGLVFPDSQDAEWAMKAFERLYLGHRVEIIDCFIAATAARLQIPILTRNIRHFTLFDDVILQVPY